MSSILQNIDPYTQPSFTYKNRLARLSWSIVYTLLFRFSPRTLHPWRSFLLRCFGATIGTHCHIYPSAKIWAPWNLEMHDFSTLGDGVKCYSIGKVTIGFKVCVSQGAYLCTGTHNYENLNFQLLAKPIQIRDHAWICTESFITPGVMIGEGAVIGARSVVTKDMPQWTVCAGNPCKPIKPRIIQTYEDFSISINLD
jgi:putative colanic acid biosynthesis acetyltransferase WcaF